MASPWGPRKGLWQWGRDSCKPRVASSSQELEEARKTSSLEPWDRAWPCWVWTSGSQNCGRIHLYCFEPPICGNLLLAVTGHSYTTCCHRDSDWTQEWGVWTSEGLCSDVGQIPPGARSSHQQGPGRAALGIRHQAARLDLPPLLPSRPAPPTVRTCKCFPLQLPFPQLCTKGFGLGRGFSKYRPWTTSDRSTWGCCSRCRFLAPPRPFESEQNRQRLVRKSGCPGSWCNGVWHLPYGACPADTSGHRRASSLAHGHGEAV